MLEGCPEPPLESEVGFRAAFCVVLICVLLSFPLLSELSFLAPGVGCCTILSYFKSESLKWYSGVS